MAKRIRTLVAQHEKAEIFADVFGCDPDDLESIGFNSLNQTQIMHNLLSGTPAQRRARLKKLEKALS